MPFPFQAQQTPRDKIVEFLSRNHGDMRELIKPLTKQRNELLTHNNKDWKDKIQEQYIHQAKYMIAEQITFAHGIDTETIIVFLESFDFGEYIQGTSVDWCI